MPPKLFTLDKNYLLKEAQEQLQDLLLHELVLKAKNIYLTCFNPLGLVDDTINTISQSPAREIRFLDPFYHELSGIYRFKYGENQLEILFDGTTHFEKYFKDWKRTFHRWTNDFMEHKHFLRAVLEGAYLRPDPLTHELIQVRLKLFLESYFGLRVYVYRGIRKIHAA